MGHETWQILVCIAFIDSLCRASDELTTSCTSLNLCLIRLCCGDAATGCYHSFLADDEEKILMNSVAGYLSMFIVHSETPLSLLRPNTD